MAGGRIRTESARFAFWASIRRAPGRPRTCVEYALHPIADVGTAVEHDWMLTGHMGKRHGAKVANASKTWRGLKLKSRLGLTPVLQAPRLAPLELAGSHRR
jgi:hypothetical protein